MLAVSEAPIRLAAHDRSAIDKCMDLLASFRGQDARRGVGVSELARRTALSKSTAYRLLGMLVTNGVVERVDNRYRLGQRLQVLGGQMYADDLDLLRDAITPHVADIYELTHETVHLAVMHGIEIVYLNKLHGYRTVRSPSRIGGRVPAYCTSLGKILLAHDPAAAQATVASGLAARTPRTITTERRLADELARIRREGIAFDDEEARTGLSCVAVPIIGPNGHPLGALSVAGATERFNTRAVSEALRRVGHAASRSARAALRPA